MSFLGFVNLGAERDLIFKYILAMCEVSAVMMQHCWMKGSIGRHQPPEQEGTPSPIECMNELSIHIYICSLGAAGDKSCPHCGDIFTQPKGVKILNKNRKDCLPWKPA